MGWTGVVVLGVVIGLAGWWAHPLRRTTRVAPWLAAALGVAASALALMAGNVTNLFHDGDTLEWPVCTGFALVVVALAVGVFRRR